MHTSVPVISGSPRVNLPILVEIGDTVYETLHWSLDGFCIESVALKEGQIIDPRLLIQFNSITVAFKVCAKLAVLSERQAEFIFTKLDPDQAGVLNQVIDDYITDQASKIDNFLENSGIIEPKQTKRYARELRIAALFGLFIIAISGLILAICGAVFTQQSQVAALVAPGVTLRATVGGVYTGINIVPGAVIERGILIGRITNPDLVARQAALSSTLESTKLEIDRQSLRLADLRSATETFKAFTQERLNALNGQAASIKEQVRLQKDLIDKRETLVRKRYYAPNVLAAEKILEEAEESALRGTEASILLTSMQDAMAKAGMSTLADTGTFESERSMAVRIAQAQATVSTIREQLKAIDKSTEVRSPCHCRIVTTSARPGDTIVAGTRLFTLRDLDVTSEKQEIIQALLPIDKVDGLTVGSGATAVLSTGKITTGRLERIMFENDPHLVGLPDETITAERKYAIATIRLYEPIDGQVGVPANVFFRARPLTNVMARLISLVGG